jgi:hypothetical protein
VLVARDSFKLLFKPFLISILPSLKSSENAAEMTFFTRFFAVQTRARAEAGIYLIAEEKKSCDVESTCRTLDFGKCYERKRIKSLACENMVARNMSKRGFLIGERIYLRPFSRDDVSYVRKWSDDFEIRRLTGEVAPMRQAETEKFYEELRADKNRIWFVIVLKRGKQVIGEAGLLRMFRPWRCTDMTIIIGDKDAWGKGYGTEAGRQIGRAHV